MGILHQLRERRVFHALAVYVGASWGVVEFVSMAEQRYRLSPHLTDLVLLTLVLLLPSVLLLAYRHGKPGKDAWGRPERLGVPANLVIALAVLSFTFSGKSLGATTTTLSVTDETGRSIQREVPRAEFRKRLAVFVFDAEPGDTAGLWLRYGLPLAISTDLQQDLFVDVRCSCVFAQELKDAGFPDGSGVPLALKKKVAQERHLPYFVSGRLATTPGGVLFVVSLHETARGRLLQERRYEGTDPLALVDEATIQLRRDLGIPSGHLEGTQDLPAAEVTSRSLPALRELADGYAAMLYGKDWAGAARHFDAAVALDPGFAQAERYQSEVYRVLNQAEKANGALESLMGHLFRLPESQQFAVKSLYYFYRQEPEKAFAAARMRTELFPDDVDALVSIGSIYLSRDDKDAAITAYKRVLELDPGRHEFLPYIGRLFEQKGDPARALGYYERYVRAFPEEVRAYVPIADLRRQQGRYAEARENYEKALLLDPARIALTVRLADLERDHGRFAEAERLYADALASARTAEDSASALQGLRGYAAFRGRHREALRHEHVRAAALRSTSPLAATTEQIRGLPYYVLAGEPKAALEKLAVLSRDLRPPYDLFEHTGRMAIYLELEQPAEAEAALSRMEAVAEAASLHAMRPSIAEGRGRIAEVRGRCDEALPHFRRRVELDPSELSGYGLVGRCLRKLGRHVEAAESLRRVLTAQPFHPRSNYELGLVYQATGDDARAREHLGRAVRAWDGADADFRMAADARRALDEFTPVAR